MEQPKKTARFIAFSLLFHALILALVIWVVKHDAPLAARGKIPVRLLERKSRPDLKSKSIIEAPKNSNQLRPDQAEYLSERDNLVKHEKKQRNPLGNSEASSMPSRPSPPSPKQVQSKLNRQQASALIRSLIPSANQRLSMGDMGKLDVFRNSNDTDDTDVNSWRYEYAGFSNRMRSQIAHAWHPLEVLKREDPYGKLTVGKRLITVLRVRIDHRGRIRDVDLVETCGIPALDLEAAHAVREGAPFINPPLGLFNGLELFSFNFTFEVDIGSGSSFDFNW